MGLTIWDDIEENIERELQTVVGEDFVITPMKSRPNGKPVVDRSRGAVLVCATFTRQSTQDDFNPSALSSKGLKFTHAAQRDPILEVIAADIGYPLRQGDFVVRCANEVKYEVEDPRPNGHGIYFAKLIERGISESVP